MAPAPQVAGAVWFAVRQFGLIAATFAAGGVLLFLVRSPLPKLLTAMRLHVLPDLPERDRCPQLA